MLLPSQHRELTETYKQLYLGEVDDITDVMIEEVVEELVEECVEFGYDLDEAAELVEEAATEYLMELNPYAPAGSKQARAYQKSTTSTKRGEARKAAVKGAVERVKSTARGVKAAAGIAGSIAKDEARRVGRSATHAVTHAVQKKKAEVKGGIKKMIGGGLRAAAGGLGKIAKKAAGAASKFGEEVEIMKHQKERGAIERRKKMKGYEPPTKGVHGEIERRNAQKPPSKLRSGSLPEEVEIYDVVLEYLMSEGHADTIAEAEYIMTELDSEMVDQIVETRMDPRGRPASGPMNVYAKNKPNTDPKFQAALQSVRDADAKKTPEQRKAELDAYKARQANR